MTPLAVTKRTMKAVEELAESQKQLAEALARIEALLSAPKPEPKTKDKQHG